MLNLKVGDKVKIKSRADLEGGINTIASIDLFSDKARVDCVFAANHGQHAASQRVSEVVDLNDLVLVGK